MSLSLALALSVSLCQAAPDAANPSHEQVKASVEKSLPFLMEGAALWREGKTAGGQNGRICVTCHQLPFTIWSHNEAVSRGVKIDQAKLDDLTAWTLEWCRSDKNAKTSAHTGGHLGTMQQLIMGRGSSPPSPTEKETYELFGRVIGTLQKEEGLFKEGNQIKRDGGEREANEIDTMWTILGLTSLEQLGEAVPQATREAAAENRAKALQWLQTGKPGGRSDWLALRSLVDREFEGGKQAEELVKQLLAQQNADGGWPLVAGEASHPLVTGQCLYVLSIHGRSTDDPVIGRARKYLLDGQQADGSWKAGSRRNAAQVNVITTHWGTGWATIGLVRTLPK